MDGDSRGLSVLAYLLSLHLISVREFFESREQTPSSKNDTLPISTSECVGPGCPPTRHKVYASPFWINLPIVLFFLSSGSFELKKSTFF